MYQKAYNLISKLKPGKKGNPMATVVPRGANSTAANTVDKKRPLKGPQRKPNLQNPASQSEVQYS